MSKHLELMHYFSGVYLRVMKERFYTQETSDGNIFILSRCIISAQEKGRLTVNLLTALSVAS